MINRLKNFGKKLTYRRSFYVVLVGSYTLLLLMSVVLSFIVYNGTSRVVRNEILNMNEIQHKLLASRFDAQVSETENLMSRINANRKISSFLRKVKNNELTEPYEREEISRELGNARVNMEFVSDVYIFFKNADLVISDKAPMRKSIAYDIYHSREEFSFEEWNEMMTNSYVRTFAPIKMVMYDVYSDTEIAYLQTIPVAGSDDGEATLVIIIETERFMDTFGDLNDEKRNTLFVTNKEGETLFTNGSQPFANGLSAQLSGKKGTFNSKVDRVAYIFSYEQSSVNNDIYYVSMISRAAFWKNMRTIRNIAMGAIFGMLIIGGFFVLYFSKKNFSPTQEIVKKINRDFGKADDKIGNEHSYILNALNEAHKQIVTTSNNLRMQNNKLRDYFLKGLLQGRYMDERYIQSSIRHYGIYADSGEYIVFLLNVYECETLFSDYDCSINEQEGMVSFILSNVLNDLLSEEYKCVTALLDENITACIIRAVDGAEEKISEVIKEMYAFVSENFGIYFTASVSKRHSFKELPEAYFEALSASKAEQSEELPAFYEESGVAERDYAFDGKTEQILLNLIKTGEKQKATEFISDFLEANQQALSGKETGLSLKYDILSAMLKALKGKDYEQFLSTYHPAVRLEKATTLGSVKRILLELLDCVCQCVQNGEKQDRSVSLCRKIVGYVEEHYGDSNLSIVMLGDYFEMTPHYLSKQFKNETGENLKTYINMYRIQKSKELIAVSNKNLNEIAQEVGFIDSNAFIRVFKQCEGITPGKYRELHQ